MLCMCARGKEGRAVSYNYDVVAVYDVIRIADVDNGVALSANSI